MHRTLSRTAAALAETLRICSCRVVFAESCTGGLVSATLAQIPGISEFLCGSAVVYRLDTKHRWLGISQELLIDPGPVSAAVAEAMAVGVLAHTPEANWAAAVTGHLGPHAPEGEDGLVFIAVARREATAAIAPRVTVQQHWLGNPPGNDGSSPLRQRRQIYAVEMVLQTLHQQMHSLQP